MSRSMKALFFLLTFFLATTSFANNPGVSYQGRIFKPDGNPLEGTTVQFRMQVRSPGSENCLLYEEVQTLNMAGSSGVFALTLNDGTGTRLDAATYQVDRIFANRETMTLDTTRCATGTTYTPNSSDGRKLVVYFKDETMAAYEAMPLMNLNYVPQAMYALEAQKVDKFEVSSILRAVDGSGNPATAPALNPTQLLNLNTLLATPAANYVQTTSNGSAALPIVAGNPSSGLAAGQIWYDSGSNVMKYYDGAVKTFGTSGGGVTSVATGTGLTGGPITTTGTINVDVGVTTGKIIQVAASNKLPAIDGSNLTNITATDATKLPLAGGTMTGPLVNNSNSASTALAVTQAGAGYAASFMGGNVGIGTASPGSVLSIQGSNFGAGTGSAPSALSVVGGTGGSTGGNGGSITLTAGAATVFTGGGGGNIGLVAGANSGAGGNITLTSGWGLSGGGSSAVLNLTGGIGGGAAGTVSLTSGDGGNGSAPGGNIDIIAGNGAAGSSYTGGTITLSAGAGSGASGSGANVILNGGAKSGSGTEGNVILANSRGNVGIGTTSPQATLDIKGTVKISGSISGAVGFAVPAAAGSATYTLPAAAPGSSMFLQSDAAGTLSWSAAGGGSPGGSSGQIQYNNSSAFGGSSLLTFDPSNAGGPKVTLNDQVFGGIIPGHNRGVSIASSGPGPESGYTNLTSEGVFIYYCGGPSCPTGTTTSISADTIRFSEIGSVGSSGNFPLSLVTNNLQRVTVTGTGNVGIGTTSPQTTLQVAGIISPATNNTYSLGNATYRFTEVYATNGTINTSDRREKKDIYDTDLGLDFINKLRPVSYRWNTGVDDDVHYGLIAQEAEQVIAETGKSEKTSIVTHDETTDRYGVRYSELISPLIKAVQELYNRFLGVDREIASVKAENATIKQENATIKQENATIKQENAELNARLDQQEKELAAIKNKLGL